MDLTTLIYGDDRHINLFLCSQPDCRNGVDVAGTLLVNSVDFQNDQVTIIPSLPLLPDQYYGWVIGNQIRNHLSCGATNQGVRYYLDFRTSP